MKIVSVLLIFTLGLLYGTAADAQASETQAQLAGATHPAFTENYGYPPEVVAGAIQARLKKDGIAARHKKDVITATAVRYAALSGDALDIYFQVSGRGRKDKDGSTVNLFISRGKDNFIGQATDATLAREAERYLDNLVQDITAYSLSLQIQATRKDIDKQSSSYKKLLKSSQKLQNKRYSLQRDVSGEMNPSKQDKLKNKLRKIDRDINDKQQDIKEAQRKLERGKDQLTLLENQMSSGQRQ